MDENMIPMHKVGVFLCVCLCVCDVCVRKNDEWEGGKKKSNT